jgi:hypothetical protein
MARVVDGTWACKHDLADAGVSQAEKEALEAAVAQEPQPEPPAAAGPSEATRAPEPAVKRKRASLGPTGGSHGLQVGLALRPPPRGLRRADPYA